MGIVTVEIKGGRKLIPRDITGRSDPFCKVFIGNCVYQTHHCVQTLEPTWNETFTFYDTPAYAVLHVECFDFDLTGEAEFMGCLRIDAAAMCSGGGWTNLGIRRGRGATVSESDRVLWLQHNCCLGEINLRWSHFHSELYAECVTRTSHAKVKKRQQTDSPVDLLQQSRSLRALRKVYASFLTAFVFLLGLVPNTLAHGVAVTSVITAASYWDMTFLAFWGVLWYELTWRGATPVQCPRLLQLFGDVLYDDESTRLVVSLFRSIMEGGSAGSPEAEQIAETLLRLKPELCQALEHLLKDFTGALQNILNVVTWQSSKASVVAVKVLCVWCLMNLIGGIIFRGKHLVVFLTWLGCVYVPLLKVVPQIGAVSLLPWKLFTMMTRKFVVGYNAV